MATINYASAEINLKIVYYGPGLSGKTTNLQYIYYKLSPNSRGKLISLDTDLERTLFFDFLPVELGEINGWNTRIHIYTVPGQVYYNDSRRLVLRGTDGIVFIADSQESRREANVFSLQNLLENCETDKIKLDRIPFVIQYNKRDIPEIISLALLQRELNFNNYQFFEASAIDGTGVFKTLKAITKMVIQNVDKQIPKSRML